MTLNQHQHQHLYTFHLPKGGKYLEQNRSAPQKLFQRLSQVWYMMVMTEMATFIVRYSKRKLPLQFNSFPYLNLILVVISDKSRGVRRRKLELKLRTM